MGWRPWTGVWRFAGLFAFAAVLSLASPAHADITYIYDQLGRLRAVVDPASDTAIYTYDAVGNLLSITRQPSSQVAIIEFNPTSGPVGTTVTISGTGFSATPSQNTVTFNGIAATVTSATTTQLITTVPSGASTGPIGVTAPGGSATSSQPFSVSSSSGAPTISSFTPSIGIAGTAVSIAGTNFETTLANTRLAFHQTRAQVTSATATTLATSVPAKATSGRLSVATPAGSATSAADFFVPPAPYTAADVGFTDRMTIGGTKTVTIGTASKIGLVVFDGTAGQRISLRATNVTIPSGVATLYTPQGTTLGPQLGYYAGGDTFLDTQTLPTTGTYQIVVDPYITYTGSLTLTLYNVPPDITGSLTPGGSSLTVTTTAPGQNVQLTFNGTAGQRVSVTFTNVTASTSGYTPYYAYIDKPDSTNLVPATPIGVYAGGFIDSTLLPVTGTYTLRIDPQGPTTGSMTVTVYDVVDLTGSITIGGSAVTVTTTTPGQNGRITFTGTAGQRLGLLVAIGTLPSPWAYVSILKPDSTTLTGPTFVIPPRAFLEPPLLPVTGTYTILVDPRDTATGSVTLTLTEIPADVTGTITPGGAAVAVSITAAGQNARLTFSGTAGRRISLRFTSVTIANSNIAILKPDNSTLSTFPGVGTGGGFWDVQTLPTTGTYTIVIDPQGTATGNMTVTLYDVPADVTGTLTINGGGVAVTITTPGQNGSLTFSGTANQQVTVRVTDNTVSSVTVTLLKPDGSYLTSANSGAASFNLTQQTLPTTGTYTVKVDPYSYYTGSLTLSVTSP